jgi:O-antigen/teichoic acid export membrane protein
VNIFIAIKYSQATLGYYFFMIRLMKLPAGLLGSSIAQVFYREASEKYNRDKNIQSLVLKLIKKLVLISAGPIILFYFIAEDLFGTIFGKEWVIAGSYAKSITPYIFFHFIASPLGMIPLIVNKQEKAFFWGLFESLLFMVVFVYGYFIYEDLLVSLDILSLIMGLYFIVYFIWIHKIGKASN